jgi:hypothetical protein
MTQEVSTISRQVSELKKWLKRRELEMGKGGKMQILKNYN